MDSQLLKHKAEKVLPLFKKHLRQEEDFGITKAVMDRLVYIQELLGKATLTRISEDSEGYLVSSKLSLSSKEPLGLEYHFLAKDQNSAEQIFEIYKEEMDKAVLKVLLGFWKVANDRGKFDYTADITEIMEKTADVGRESYFSVKEKKKFWALSKLLESTKLTLVIPYKHKKHRNAKEKILTIEHRLIEIFARDSEKDEDSKGYPNKINVRVLNPEEFKEKAQLATAIANGTLRLAHRDILLALSVQTRAAQRRDVQEMQCNEDFLIERSHLRNTKEANSSVARLRLKEKLDRVKESGAMADWSKVEDCYRIRQSQRSSQNNPII